MVFPQKGADIRSSYLEDLPDGHAGFAWSLLLQQGRSNTLTARDRPRIGSLETGHQPDEGGFSTTVPADDAYPVIFVNRERHVSEKDLVAIALGDILNAQQRLRNAIETHCCVRNCSLCSAETNASSNPPGVDGRNSKIRSL